MMSNIDKIIDRTVAKEGGYSNHPNDTGGETMFGITVGIARQCGYAGPMRHLTRAKAVEIYKTQYFIRPGFAELAKISEAIAEECFDTGVNMGPTWGGIFLQRSLNGLNNQGTFYADLKVDGAVGRATRNALDAYLKRRGRAEGTSVVLKGMNCLQGARYIELAEKRQKNEAFLHGWLRTRIELPQ